MSTAWSLLEYRPGRYVKVTPEGDFLGKATEAEVKAWFASQGWLSPATPEPSPQPATPPQTAPEPPPGRELTPTEHPPGNPLAWFSFAPEPSAPHLELEEDSAPLESGVETLLALEPEPLPVALEVQVPQFDSVLGLAELETGAAAPTTETCEPKGLVAQLGMELAPPEEEPADEPEPVAQEAILAAPEPEPPLTEAREPEEPAAQSDLESTPPAEAPEDLESERAALAFEPPPGTGKWAGLPAHPPEAVLGAGSGNGEDASAMNRWLWVDPRQESGYQPASFDLAAFLQRAIALFQSKEWTGGQRPGRLAVHPSQARDGLKAIAEGLGLEVVSDPLVSPDTYRLGLTKPRAKS